jgi:peptide/nickel transport system substrate-binding protein
MKNKLTRSGWFLGALILLQTLFLTACTPKVDSVPITPTSTPTRLPPTSTPQPTPHPQDLIVCATEPQAVSPFWSTQSADDVLALFYKPPIEYVGYDWVPRLVERIPTLENGDVMVREVSVSEGMRYADPTGEVHIYTDENAVDVPQLSVDFTLKQELKWSDGEEIRARDAVLGYHLAQSEEAQGYWRWLAERTARFFALDDYTLHWEGIPGFMSAEYPNFLFPLQPYHRWQGFALPQILQDRTPLATGPFQIIAWETGREVRLAPNPTYNGNPPMLDSITVRFPQQSPQQWGALITAGACDIILPEPAEMIEWRDWAELQEYGYINLISTNAPVILRLDFNISPKEPSPVSEKAVRQGIAACIDRANIASTLPGEAAVIARGFLPPGHPAYESGETATAPVFNDSELGQSTLADAGWVDEDGDGTREAHDVTGFTDGHPLSVTMHMAPQYFVLAAHLAANIEACGIDIKLLPTDANLLYSPQEASPLYGRTFEMALFGWQVDIPQICGAWFSSRIPGEENNWSGENFSGYKSEMYDTMCTSALSAVDGEVQRAELLGAQSLINLDVPTLFLTWRPHYLVSQPYVQGIQLDASAVGTLWNAEALTIQE